MKKSAEIFSVFQAFSAQSTKNFTKNTYTDSIGIRSETAYEILCQKRIKRFDRKRKSKIDNSQLAAALICRL